MGPKTLCGVHLDLFRESLLRDAQNRSSYGLSTQETVQHTLEAAFQDCPVEMGG